MVSTAPVMVIWMVCSAEVIFISMITSLLMLLAAATFSLAAFRTSSGVAGLPLAQAARERAMVADMAIAAPFLNHFFML